MKANDDIMVSVAMGYDYNDATTGTPSSTATAGTPWGSPWGSSWGAASPAVYKKWHIVSGSGSEVSLLMRFSRQGDRPQWIQTNVLGKPGGNL